MNRLLLIIFVIFFSACKHTDDRNLLYKQLENYNADLKMTIKSQDTYLSQKYNNDEYLKRRFDSLNEIKIAFEKEFEILRYRDKNKVLLLRDNFNINNDLRLELNPTSSYENIPDSTFNDLIENDILRLKKEFQNRWLFIHTDKFE